MVRRRDGGQEALKLCLAARGGRPFRGTGDANMPDLDGFGVAEQTASTRELANPSTCAELGTRGEAERCRACIAAYLTNRFEQST